MSHEIAKLLLAHADTPAEKDEAIVRAMELGMPLHQVEEFLDWLDVMRARVKPTPPSCDNGRQDLQS